MSNLIENIRACAESELNRYEATMNYEDEIEALEVEWLPEQGFFWKVRQGLFSTDDFDRALKTILAIPVVDDATLPRRLVSLLWYVPIFMQWQVERVQQSGSDGTEYALAITTMTNSIGKLLGVP